MLWCFSYILGYVLHSVCNIRNVAYFRLFLSPPLFLHGMLWCYSYILEYVLHSVCNIRNVAYFRLCQSPPLFLRDMLWCYSYILGYVLHSVCNIRNVAYFHKVQLCVPYFVVIKETVGVPCEVGFLCMCVVEICM